MQSKLEEEREKLVEERSYSKRVRCEREELKGEVQSLKASLKGCQKKAQEQASTIQALEKHVKRGRDLQDGEFKKKITASLQGQVEKRFRAWITEMDAVFKESGYVFDPAASSDSESEEEGDADKPQERPREDDEDVKVVEATDGTAAKCAKNDAIPETSARATEKESNDADMKAASVEPPAIVLPAVTSSTSPSSSENGD